jgi:site-specific recombinase XerD
MENQPVQIVQNASGLVVPQLIGNAGERTSWRFVEFFTVNIRNVNTRAAYGRAAGLFLRWCEEIGISDLAEIRPMHVATYIEQLQGKRAAPTVKQHLACLRMLFDWLVTGQIIPSNPVHSVRGPRHSVSKGSTAVISSAEARELLDSMDTSAVVGLRDRALVAVMAFTFARVSAVVGLKVHKTRLRSLHILVLLAAVFALRVGRTYLVIPVGRIVGEVFTFHLEAEMLREEIGHASGDIFIENGQILVPVNPAIDRV